ncbi:cytochrome c [bacterium]|nr:cytochrome c [bacterium]
MKKAFKWIGIILGALVLLLVLGIGGMFMAANGKIKKTYEVAVKPIAIPTDSASLSRGEHLALTRGCMECHGADFEGKLIMDNPAMGTWYGPNLTKGNGGLPADYSTEDFVRAIRHGVGKDNQALLFMPSEEYHWLDDADLGSLIAYIQSVPSVDSTVPKVKPGPVSKMLFLSGQIPVSADIIDHNTPPPPAPEYAISSEYGRYIAVTCTGCHGPGFSGGKIPGGDPSWPPATNISSHKEEGIGSWSEEEFLTAMHFGMRPDESSIDPVMPWPMFGQMTDIELKALWMYLKTVPPKPTGNR